MSAASDTKFFYAFYVAHSKHCVGNKDDTESGSNCVCSTIMFVSPKRRLAFIDISFFGFCFVFFVSSTLCVHCGLCIHVRMTTSQPINIVQRSSYSSAHVSQSMVESKTSKASSFAIAKVSVIYVKKQCSVTACIRSKAKALQRIHECRPGECDDTLK